MENYEFFIDVKISGIYYLEAESEEEAIKKLGEEFNVGDSGFEPDNWSLEINEEETKKIREDK